MRKNIEAQQMELWPLTVIYIFELFPIFVECGICDTPTLGEHWFPMYEGKIVNEDHPEWGGFIVCDECYEKHKPEE